MKGLCLKVSARTYFANGYICAMRAPLIHPECTNMKCPNLGNTSERTGIGVP